MFDRTADRYDLINDVLSAGQDRLWRRVVARELAAGPGQRVLDLAAGTGASSRTFADSGAQCIGCDFSFGMLSVARRNQRRERRSRPERARRLRFVAGDATRLPFHDAVFDAVTMSFGLRNVADMDATLAEMLRVTRPGGRLLICEFSHIPQATLDRGYTTYLHHLLPRVARLIASNPEAYCYLSESIEQWPDQASLARRIQLAGWGRVAWRNLTFGIVALHRGIKPAGTRGPWR